jgi:hypothetical protein
VRSIQHQPSYVAVGVLWPLAAGRLEEREAAATGFFVRGCDEEGRAGRELVLSTNGKLIIKYSSS